MGLPGRTGSFPHHLKMEELPQQARRRSDCPSSRREKSGAKVEDNSRKCDRPKCFVLSGGLPWCVRPWPCAHAVLLDRKQFLGSTSGWQTELTNCASLTGQTDIQGEEKERVLVLTSEGTKNTKHQGANSLNNHQAGGMEPHLRRKGTSRGMETGHASGSKGQKSGPQKKISSTKK